MWDFSECVTVIVIVIVEKSDVLSVCSVCVVRVSQRKSVVVNWGICCVHIKLSPKNVSLCERERAHVTIVSTTLREALRALSVHDSDSFSRCGTVLLHEWEKCNRRDPERSLAFSRMYANISDTTHRDT